MAPDLVFPPPPDSVVLDLANGRLRRGTTLVQLRPKDTSVLQRLVDRPDELVSKTTLMGAAWGDVTVTESVLKACINRLRAALGDHPQSPRFIQTVHRRGYRFIARWPLVDVIDDGRTLTSTAIVRASAPPIVVGRGAELANLDACFADAAAGRRRVVMVGAEAGLGKTTLVDFFLETRVPAGTIVGRGQCVEQYGAGEAYVPLFQALRSMTEGQHGRYVTTRLVERAPSWVAEMPGVVSVGRGAARRRGATRDRMLREYAEVIDVLARDRPVVIVLEDLHWSDASTLDALALVALRYERARVLVIGTYRPEETPQHEHALVPLLNTLRERQRVLELALPPLGRAAAEAYVTRRFPGIELPATLGAAVHAATEGHPLFVSALADHWVTNGWVTRTTGGWERRADVSTLTEDVPDDVRQMIEVRLARLTPDERELAESASVCGNTFTAASVAAARGMDAAAADEACRALTERRRLFRSEAQDVWPDGTSSGRYRFVHALYREIAYEHVTAARRQVEHHRIAAREEAGHAGRLAAVAGRLAMHFEAAHALARALPHRETAARQAAAVGGFAETITHARAGLNLVRSLGETARNTELPLQLLLGAALAATEGFASAAAAAAYGRARDFTNTPGCLPHSVAGLAGLYAYHLMRGPVAATGEIAEQFLAHAVDTGHEAGRVWGLMALGVQRLQRGCPAAARTLLEESVGCYVPADRVAYQEVHAVDPRVASLGYLSWTYWMLGDSARARASGQSAVAFSRECGDPVDLAHAYVLQSHLWQLLGDAGAAAEAAGHAIVLSEDYGLGQYLWPARITRGWARVMGGEPEGILELEQAIHAWGASGARYSQPRHFGLLADALIACGRRADAAEAVARGLAETEGTGECFWESELHRLRAELEIDMTTTAHAHGSRAYLACQRAIAVAREQGARPLEIRAAETLARLNLSVDAVGRKTS